MPTTQEGLGTYRFIRFVKEPVRGRHNKIDDVVKVFYDIDSSPQGFFDTGEFIDFLDDKFSIQKNHPNLLIRIKKALNTYGIHFVLDIKKMEISAMEEAPTKPPTLKDDMSRLLNESQKGKKQSAATFSTRQLQKSTQDIFDKLGNTSIN